jgi:hypothetical protein
MALVLADRVKETSTTTGTGTLTLAGAAIGFQSFSVIGNGNTCYYTITNQAVPAEWEVGIGTYTLSGTTLARTTILASSNAGSVVTLSAGTKDVFVTYPAGRAVDIDTAQTLTNKTLGSGTAITAGTINSATIGVTTPSSGAFTTISASGVATVSAGAVGTPSIVSPLSVNTGVYFPGANSVGISINGALRLNTTATQFTATLPWRGQNGTAAAPAFSASADTNTGMFFPAADTIAFAEGGTEALRITSTGAISVGSTGTDTGTSGQVLTSAGSGASPTWAAAPNKTTTGLWENAATISANYSITAGNNAISAGPVTIDAGVTVTVPSGSVWAIV